MLIDHTLHLLFNQLFSIVVSTYNRVEHLHTFLQHHANGSLPRLDAVFIAWVR